MKKFMLLILFGIVSINAQNVEVIENLPVTTATEGMFYHPSFSPDGEKVLFTSVNYKGLWIKNIISGDLVNLNNEDGAGYEPVFDSGSDRVIYRTNRFENMKKYSSLKIQDISSSEKVLVEKNVRDLRPPKLTGSGSFAYIKDGQLKKYSINQSLAKTLTDNKLVYIENSKIVLISNEQKRVLEPLGSGNYIWPSISPDKNKLLFTLAGKGTFVSDFEGNILADLGYANYPSWSRDGNWIVFMEDYDDGEKIISSDIFIISSDGSERYQLTDTNDTLELYPSYSPAKDELVYHTEKGRINKLVLKFN